MHTDTCWQLQQSGCGYDWQVEVLAGSCSGVQAVHCLNGMAEVMASGKRNPAPERGADMVTHICDDFEQRLCQLVYFTGSHFFRADAVHCTSSLERTQSLAAELLEKSLKEAGLLLAWEDLTNRGCTLSLIQNQARWPAS